MKGAERMSRLEEHVDRVRVFGERPEAAERMAPGFFDPPFEAESLARYEWAARWVKGRAVLDASCGTGYGASILREAGARRVVSLDVSRDALRFGFPRYHLVPVCGDAHRIPVATGTCDTVVSIETIEHLTDPLAFTRELWRVLRPGGELLLTTPNAARSKGSNPYHLHEMTIDELRGLLKNAGFLVRGVWGQYWGLNRSLWHRIKGLRRMLYEIERTPAVVTWAWTSLEPTYWCVRAIKV